MPVAFLDEITVFQWFLLGSSVPLGLVSFFSMVRDKKSPHRVRKAILLGLFTFVSPIIIAAGLSMPAGKRWLLMTPYYLSIPVFIYLLEKERFKRERFK